MEGFRRLDHSQRALAAMVESFRTYLPDRAAQSGLVPRFETLDQQAEGLIVEYLTLLDQQPYDDGLDAQRLGAAQAAYRQLAPRLIQHADALDQVVLDYDAELTRIGREVAKSRKHKEAAEENARRVAAAAARLRETGLDVAELTGLMARARTAAVSASEWQPAAGTAVIEQANAELVQVAERVETLAEDYPKRVAKAQTRRSSLGTLAQTVESRLDRVEQDLAVLRREFSIGNWRDLESVRPQVEEGLVVVRAKLNNFDRLVAAGADWALPLRLLDEVRATMDVVQKQLGSPAERIVALRGVRENPEQLMKNVRFRLRDAQLLVTTSPKTGGDAVGRDLDALVLRLDALREALEGVHPDYWAALKESEQIQEGIKQQVDRFRSLT